jgi:hypothetical protein
MLSTYPAKPSKWWLKRTWNTVSDSVGNTIEAVRSPELSDWADMAESVAQPIVEPIKKIAGQIPVRVQAPFFGIATGLLETDPKVGFVVGAGVAAFQAFQTANAILKTKNHSPVDMFEMTKEEVSRNRKIGFAFGMFSLILATSMLLSNGDATPASDQSPSTEQSVPKP